MKQVAILSIDGGGIRGIIPGTILQLIEEKIQEKTANPQARLVDYFDFVAGTSTGGILGCGMLMPDPAMEGRPKFSMEEVVNLYHENGGDIFKKPLGHKLRTLFGVREEKYPNDNLKKALHEYFGDTYLSEMLKPCLFTAYDIESRKSTFFKWGKACDDISHDFYIRDVAQATAAAPTYFEAALIKSRFGSSYPLIDGGVFANNPAMCAYAEVRKCDFDEIKKPTSKDMLMISLGTGSVKEPFPYERAKKFGLVQWIKPLIDIMMSGNSETVSHQLEWLFDAGNNQEGFIRVEPELHEASPSMDDASTKNMNALRDAAIKFVKDNPEKINNVVDKLIANKEEI
ncbi:patatin family protein [Indibacter alkaliphilus LW1]|jgi:patatin-like phospholipase/acyl hydrolase|uniref:Patatin family protein n=1 Tax=Indibacter alkaliphilus (strain CCUG 57479 / KCTC 22604 / LW1) TaxID=1189612 RepID=S2E8L6_INDAL|nr:patatin-like phospholipase family protein [Indibacter alkaliphilus]EOZ98633.1 patatin family protein [Indibacter alkaliphilus LW1]